MILVGLLWHLFRGSLSIAHVLLGFNETHWSRHISHCEKVAAVVKEGVSTAQYCLVQASTKFVPADEATEQSVIATDGNKVTPLLYFSGRKKVALDESSTIFNVVVVSKSEIRIASSNIFLDEGKLFLIVCVMWTTVFVESVESIVVANVAVAAQTNCRQRMIERNHIILFVERGNFR